MFFVMSINGLISRFHEIIEFVIYIDIFAWLLLDIVTFSRSVKRYRQWRIQRRPPPPPLFYDQTETRRAEKYFFETPPPSPFLKVLMTGMALTRCPKHFRTSSPKLYVFSWWATELIDNLVTVKYFVVRFIRR